MRKITVIVLLGCLFFTTIGYHFVFKMHLKNLKAEVRRGLRQSRNRRDVTELHLSRMQLAELQWEEEDEFLWQGEMFDVLEKLDSGDHTIIRCISDKKEKQLLEEYRKHTEKNQRRGKSPVVQLLTENLLPPSFSLPALLGKQLDRYFFFPHAALPLRQQPIISPPPDVMGEW